MVSAGPTAVLTVACSSPYEQTRAGGFAITVQVTTLSFTASSGTKPSPRTLKFTYPIIK